MASTELSVAFIANGRGNSAGKLAEAELHFTDDRDRAPGQMLLVTDVLVRGDQHVTPGGFSGCKVAVYEGVPALRFRGTDGMSGARS